MDVNLLLRYLKDYYQQLASLNLLFDVETHHNLIIITASLRSFTRGNVELFTDLKDKLNENINQYTNYLSTLFLEIVNYLVDYRIENINISFSPNDNHIQHYFNFNLIPIDRKKVEIYKQLEKQQLISNQSHDSRIVEWLYDQIVRLSSQFSTLFLAVTYYDIVHQLNADKRSLNSRFAKLSVEDAAKLSGVNKLSEVNKLSVEELDVNLAPASREKKLAAVSLLLASKLEDVRTYRIEEIYEGNLILLERQVYDMLNQRLILPTAYLFYRSMSLNQLTRGERDYIKFILLATLYHPKINQLNPSLIAISAIYLGVSMKQKKVVWNDEYKYMSGYDKFEILSGASRLSEMLNEITKSDYVHNLITLFQIENLIDFKHPQIYINERLAHIHRKDQLINLKSIELDRRMGGGKYGIVYRATYQGREYAAKIAYCSDDFLGLNKDMLREIAILKFIRHPNIISLICTLYNEEEANEIDPNCYGFIMELMDTNLYERIKRQKSNPFSMIQVQKWTFQILNAINYLHERGIIHRDLKPENILIKNEDLKIGDFGLGRSMVNYPWVYTQPVVTLWYRPPELLIGYKTYGFKVDMWSCGCIIGELATLIPLFPHLDEFEMIKGIIDLLGSKKMLELPGMRRYIVDDIPAVSFELYFRTNNIDFLKLITGLLEPNPQTRYDSQVALASPWLVK